MREIYPSPKKLEYVGGNIRLNGKVQAEKEVVFAVNAFCRAVNTMSLTTGEGNIKLIYDETIGNPEGYRIHIGEMVEIYAKTRSGFVYAAATLSQLISEDGSVPCLELYDEPYKKVRGVHMYLPPCDGLDEFCRILDALAYLKYNTLILEIGGGMEYERHPEINMAWRKFCREAMRYPGGPQGLQASEEYWKDSTHVELAGGDVLTKGEVKRLVEYAHSLGMEVIPEIQALSHAYYLTLAHREIAERPHERWPDSYCPLNEESYKLYFDVADEIYETIGFDKVSIGHDEIRVLAQCPRCKGHSGHELLAYEINKLHEFYSAKGVEVWMWGEMLQNFLSFQGNMSGDGVDKVNRFGRRHLLPKTYEALDKIPRDIVMIDWQYSSAPNSEQGFLERGIRQIYGNFSGSTIAEWQTRSARENVLGAEVSTWCVAGEDEIARNGWFTEFIFSSAVLWQNDYCDEMREEIYQKTINKLPEIRSIVRGEEKVEMHGLTFSHENNEYRVSHEQPSLDIGVRCEALTFEHTADYAKDMIPKRCFTWFFKDRKPYICAHYVVEYEDGIKTGIPIEFGVQTGAASSDFVWSRPQVYEKRFDDESQKEQGQKVDFPAPYYDVLDPWLNGVSYFAQPCKREVEEQTTMIYRWQWKNPRPEVAVKRITLYPEQKESVALKWFGCLI